METRIRSCRRLRWRYSAGAHASSLPSTSSGSRAGPRLWHYRSRGLDACSSATPHHATIMKSLPARTDEDRLLPIFDAAKADVVVCGHTHMQFDRIVGKTGVVNAGSVGMPFGPPGADWLLLGAGVDLRHTNYDRESARRRIAGTGFPNAPEFDMLNPPTAEKMLELYSKAELKA